MMGPQSNGGGTMNRFCDRKIKIKNNGQEYTGMITDKLPNDKAGVGIPCFCKMQALTSIF